MRNRILAFVILAVTFGFIGNHTGVRCNWFPAASSPLDSGRTSLDFGLWLDKHNVVTICYSYSTTDVAFAGSLLNWSWTWDSGRLE